MNERRYYEYLATNALSDMVKYIIPSKKPKIAGIKVQENIK